MSDVDEIIDYMKSLKRGFDKDLFQSKIDELAHIVDSSGLKDDDFHTLFKVWLNLYLPITKWVALGTCLVPREMMEKRTIDYSLRWLLASFEDHSKFPRIVFVLDWLTAAMDSGTIDLTSLNSGYEIFFSMLKFEVLTSHSIKLVYTLTMPSDVMRWRVLELLDLAKKREGKKNMLKQIEVLLGLFKSYKPECVPEDVSAVSIHTSFKKINPTLLSRFRRAQESRNIINKERHHLQWVNPLINTRGRNKKCDPLVPNLEFTNIGSAQYADDIQQKNYLDFSDPVSLLHYSLDNPMSRPARLRALLCNEIGLTLLTVASDAEQAYLSHDLHHLLSGCFLDASPYSYTEKQDLLHRLALLQRRLLQGIPVVTRFLAQYLPLWNERDFFGEIMELLEWVSPVAPDHVASILTSLARVYHRAQPMEQCALMLSLTHMYTNLVYASTRNRRHFMSARPEGNFAQVLPYVAASISDMCGKELQVSPEDMCVVYSSVRAAEMMARAEARNGVALGALPRKLTLALPLLSTSALLIDKMATLMSLYRKIFAIMKSTNPLVRQSLVYIEQRKTLENYSFDLANCLYHETALSGRKTGLVFTKLHPQLVEKLKDLVEGDAVFSLRHSIAFAPYTFMLQSRDLSEGNASCLNSIVGECFPSLKKFLNFVKQARGQEVEMN